MLLIDYYAYNNKIAAVHPGEKFLFFALTMAITLAFDNAVTSLLVILLMAAAVVVLAGTPWFTYLKLLIVPGSFLVPGVLVLAVSVNADTASFLWSASVGPYAVGITGPGLDTAVKVFLRSLGSVSCLYFLALTTPLSDMVSLLKKIRVPSIVIELLTLIYRFIFVLLKVTGQIYTAQSSRLGYRNARTTLNSLSRIISSIFVKTYHQSQVMYDALAARCYQGNLNILEERRCLSARNLLLIVIVDGTLLIYSAKFGGLI